MGLNGKGKTNILDAIYFMCVSKSRFTSSDIHLIQHQENFFRIDAEFDQEYHLVAKYQKGKKVFELNQVPLQKIADHFGKIPIVFASPNDILIMIGGSEERRKFIDFTLSCIDHDYMTHLIQYNHFIEQKNALLKNQNQKNKVDIELLDLYNQKLVEFGLPIYFKRKNSVEVLSKFIELFYDEISSNNEKIEMVYESEVDPNHFMAQLKNNREREIAMQRSNLGIHKDDFLFLTDDKTTKRFASQGQQKTFLYALRLAQYKMIFESKSIKPILLIDDIFDKLDLERGNAFLTVLKNRNLFDQVFITDTDKNKLELFFDHEDYEIFELK